MLLGGSTRLDVNGCLLPSAESPISTFNKHSVRFWGNRYAQPLLLDYYHVGVCHLGRKIYRECRPTRGFYRGDLIKSNLNCKWST